LCSREFGIPLFVMVLLARFYFEIIFGNKSPKVQKIKEIWLQKGKNI